MCRSIAVKTFWVPFYIQSQLIFIISLTLPNHLLEYSPTFNILFFIAFNTRLLVDFKKQLLFPEFLSYFYSKPGWTRIFNFVFVFVWNPLFHCQFYSSCKMVPNFFNIITFNSLLKCLLHFFFKFLKFSFPKAWHDSIINCLLCVQFNSKPYAAMVTIT